MVPSVRVQGLEVNDPAGSVVWVKSTVPVGVLGLVALVSVTVAIQAEAWLMTIAASQLTAMDVE